MTGASLGRSSGGVMEGVLKEGKSAQRGQRPGQPWCDLKKKKSSGLFSSGERIE